jgi:hypothetical protein
MYPAALRPMRADKSALGVLPASAFQFCEAARAASAFGWYIFPPVNIALRWDGTETLYHDGEQWEQCTVVTLDDEFLDYWQQYAPADLKEYPPPYLTALPVPGVVQIWSGLLVSTAPDWSVLIRPLANIPQPLAFQCFEGIVETDQFKPCPLFVNIRLVATERDILIPRDKPLFQLQPIHRSCYAESTLGLYQEYEGIRPRLDGVAGMSREDWEGYRRTTRKSDPADDDHHGGSYGASVRRRAKREDQQC